MNQKTYLLNWRNKLSFKYKKQKQGKSKNVGNPNVVNYGGADSVRSNGVVSLLFKQEHEDFVVYLDLTRMAKKFNIQDFGFGGFQFKINNIDSNNFKDENKFTETLIKNPKELSSFQNTNFTIKVNNRFNDFQVFTKLSGNSLSVVMVYIKDSNLNAVMDNRDLKLPIFYHKDRRKNYPLQPLISFLNLISNENTCMSNVRISSKNGVNLINPLIENHLIYDNNSYHCKQDTIFKKPEISGEIIIENIPGDVNLDGFVNVTDIVSIVSHITGEQVLDEESFTNADVNEDGQVNVVDVVRIVNEILNIESDQKSQIIGEVEELLNDKDKTGENDV